MRAIITGGGTGGHIYPALAVGLKLKKMGWEVLYIGSFDGLEKKIAQEWGLDFCAVEVAPLPRNLTFELFSVFSQNIKGILQSRRYIKNFKPDIIFGTGGFVAGPLVLAGVLSGIKTLIHEQNVYPGITNKLLSHFIDRIALNFQDAISYFSDSVRKKTVVTGNPVRNIILTTTRKEGLDYFEFSGNKRTLLVFGGSQGAASINKAIFAIYNYIAEKNNLQLIHITGKKNYNSQVEDIENMGINLKDIPHIKIFPYLEHIEYAYAVSDLVISRAGATGIAEITAKGLPAILIPYPYATGNHQMYNAETMAEHGAAEIITEKRLNSAILLDKYKEIINDKDLLANMGENSFELGHSSAVDEIIEEIYKLIEE